MGEEGVWRGGEGKLELTVVPEEDFLGGGVAEPVGFCAVWERDVSGGEAAVFGVCGIRYIEICAYVPIPKCFQSIAISGYIEGYWEGLTDVAGQSCSSSRSSIPQS